MELADVSNEIVEFVEEVCGLYFRSVLLPSPGIKIPQHRHPYPHATYCGSGSAIMYVDGINCGVVHAGEAAEVKANLSHEFESLEPNTRLTCIHDTRSAALIKEMGT
jgi:quercetin dioxygenase-like cupin family protein